MQKAIIGVQKEIRELKKGIAYSKRRIRSSKENWEKKEYFALINTYRKEIIEKQNHIKRMTSSHTLKGGVS